jgi:pimeloyl-ACP methyl ester carboxylesterase
MNAAGKFRQRPAETVGHYAGAKHIIIAHSHGGTIAAQALPSLSAGEREQVRALICLATPFVYLSPLKKPREPCCFFGSLGFICTALLPILLQSLFDLPYLLYLLLSLCARIFFAGVFLLFRVDPPLEYFALWWVTPTSQRSPSAEQETKPPWSSDLHKYCIWSRMRSIDHGKTPRLTVHG